MSSYLITGTSRGIGLALATQLSSLPPTEVSVVFATARSTTPELQALIDSSNDRVVYVKLDTTNEASVEAAVSQVSTALSERNIQGLDVLINNAGIMGMTPDGITAMKDLSEHLTTNVVGVHLVTAAFVPLLKAGKEKKIVNISSTLGSIARAPAYMWGSAPAYKISKTALNMLTVQYALSYRDEGFTIFAISPGWLQTSMGSANADLPVEVGTKAVLDKIRSAGREMNGAFANIKVQGWETRDGPNQYDGKNSPW